ncbi:CHAT domain-containing protein [Thiothrix nivea]|uniref:TIR protein n=1 Tax=Thiothrix nivea (strain ATCC 35100 / DSM 5205 / JP2) TaxID=870187 RepID=A0A656HCW9_THINJ|nr:CHAT domain-containing protein [Thiothrix nivea]EIJ34991.1 TIR protein [Thiothrix nivea DSM 5205]
MSADSRHVFISHSAADDAFVQALCEKLELHHLNIWVDSRNLRGGDKLWPEVAEAIRTARYVVMVISANTVNSSWVRKEVRLAEQEGITVIPLLLPGILPAALGMWFDEEPAGEKIELDIGSLQEAMPRILAALGERLPDDLPPKQEIANKPIAELLLELSEPTFTRDANGAEQLSARAVLTYIPTDVSKERPVESRPFRFTAPIGQIEQDELRWYLEEYYRWPVGLFRERAERTEAQLPEWGKALFADSLGQAVCREPLSAWQQVRGEVERRFSVQVDASILETGEDAQANANEAASHLQSLPWELLRDDAYLCDGANPVRIRRRLPNFKQQPPSITELPIRILLLSPRPEEPGVGYIDHRASALPLVQAVESLGDLVQLTVLSPPTLAALEQELHRARDAGMAYDVLHFDGHGVYDQQYGLGALCFENPNDANQLEARRNELVHADKLAKLLKDFRIPLVFLEACQTAQAEADPNASVAASLLEEGVTSVVAMTHSVLVETARRFVTAFYQALAQGQRVGAAMLAGQKTLLRNTYRLPIPGAGDLHLQDWFVPILYQEQHDPQLFTWLPSATAQAMQARQQQTRLGRLPEPPGHTFIGRSRELLKAERLLEQQPYAVIRGQGGQGKTTLAVELARWLVRSRRFDRAAFVSVEQYTHDRAVLDVLGKQLVHEHFSVAEHGDDKALQLVQRELENSHTLVVVDNMESLLADATNSQPVLQLLAKLGNPHPNPSPRGRGANADSGSPSTAWRERGLGGEGLRLLFTTRESLPEPFHHKAREIELGALSLGDAKALVMQVMNNEGLSLRHDDQGNTPQEVDALVEAVKGHARALVLLARELAQRGVTATTANVRAIMQELEQRHPGQRELSLFASVELSLRRLSPDVREQIAGLAVFEDGGHWISLQDVMGLDEKQFFTITGSLIDVGLIKIEGEHGYIKFDPALTPYLDLKSDVKTRQKYQDRWLNTMGVFVDFLYEQHFQDSRLQSNLLQLDMANLIKYLSILADNAKTEESFASLLFEKVQKIETLFYHFHKGDVIGVFAKWRSIAASYFKEWNHLSFQQERMKIEYLQSVGQWVQAYEDAMSLLLMSEAKGEDAYNEAKYDLAMANALVGKAMRMIGKPSDALSFLKTAQNQFRELGDDAQQMQKNITSELGHCLFLVGYFSEAERAYKESLEYDEKNQNFRGIAISKSYLANIELSKNQYETAISLYQECLLIFNDLGEPAAKIIYQIGMVYRHLGKYLEAEKAYRKALEIETKIKNVLGQAHSLHELGNLYNDAGNPGRAIDFYFQASNAYADCGELSAECLARSHLAEMWFEMGDYGEAYSEANKAIGMGENQGHEALIWKSFELLHRLEEKMGNLKEAHQAWRQALTAYLAYRRDGGENNESGGCLALAVRRAIQQGDMEEAQQLLDTELVDESWGEHKNFLNKLQTIIAGERDLTLAEDDSLHYSLAAELIFLLEQLQEAGI